MRPEEAHDRELLDRCRKGDEAAFAVVVARYAGLVHSACVRILGSEEDAEDATQAVFLLLMKKASRLPASVRLSGWLHTSARYTAQNALRLREIRRKREREAAAMMTESDSSERSWSEAAPHLDAAIGSLAPAQREAVLLCYGRGLTQDAAAMEMGVAVSTVATHLKRATKRLHDKLVRVGVTASNASLGAMLSEHLVRSIPNTLVQTITASIAAGGAAASGQAMAIAKGAAKSMMMNQIKTVAMTITLVATVGGGGWSAGTHLLAGEPEVAEAPKTAEPKGASAAVEMIQAVLPDRKKGPKKLHPSNLVTIGNHVYIDSPGAIVYLKRDAGTGKLTYVGEVPGLGAKARVALCSAGGRLYAVLMGRLASPRTVAWYEIEKGTGKPVEKGKFTFTPNEKGHHYAGCPAVDAEGKNIYVGCSGKMIHFKVEADGKLVKGEDVSGNGIGPELLLAPDGKDLYSMAGGYELAHIKRSPDGSVAFKAALALKEVCPGQRYLQTKLAGCTPDGKWLYATMNNWLVVVKRDPETGTVTLQEAGASSDSSRPDFRLAAQRSLHLTFLSDGKQGFTGSTDGRLQTFRCDPATGRLSDISDVPAFIPKCFGSLFLWCDEKNGFLTGGAPGGKGYPQTPGLWVAKFKSPLPTGDRYDITTPLVGTEEAKGDVAAADWPRRKGPNGDLTSPLKGIKRNWEGGLKKVWEVKGLSPGTATYSTVSVKGNRLIVTGRIGQVFEAFCFNADKGGKPLWISDFSAESSSDYGWGDGPYSTPCITEDSVYVASKGGQIVRLDLATGEVKWRKGCASASHGYGACPAVWGDLVIAPGVDRKELGAFNKDTGKTVWTWVGVKNKGLQHASPMVVTINGVEQLVFKTQTEIVGLDKSGKKLWGVAGKKGLGNVLTPAIAGNMIVSVPAIAVKVENGSAKVLWNELDGLPKGARSGLCDPAIIDGHVYVFTVISTKRGVPGFKARRGSMWGGGFDGYLVCAELQTGKVKWAEPTGQGAFVVVDGLLLCLNFEGDLFLVDPKPDKFNKLAEIKSIIKSTPWMHHGKKYSPWGHTQTPFWAMPIVARGKVYIRYSDQLTCYDLMK